MAGFYIINAQSSQKRYNDQQVLIAELVEALTRTAPASLDSFFLQDWSAATSDAEKFRVVIDQVASLTDPGAIALHAKLTAR
jgi:dGTPase